MKDEYFQLLLIFGVIAMVIGSICWSCYSKWMRDETTTNEGERNE